MARYGTTQSELELFPATQANAPDYAARFRQPPQGTHLAILLDEVNPMARVDLKLREEAGLRLDHHSANRGKDKRAEVSRQQTQAPERRVGTYSPVPRQMRRWQSEWTSEMTLNKKVTSGGTA